MPAHAPYPEVLQPCLHRQVWKEKSLRRVLDRLRAGGAPVFIKPASGWKRFTGFIPEHADDYRLSAVSKNIEVWVSEPIQLLSEWRVYVLRAKIHEITFCDHGGDPALRPDLREIEAAVDTLHHHHLAPAGFVIDFGLTSQGQTALIEMNDGFSFGAYQGVSAQTYWDINWVRWQELVSAAVQV